MQSSILSTCLALQMKTGWEDEGPKGERRGHVSACHVGWPCISQCCHNAY